MSFSSSRLLVFFSLLLLSACTPAEQQYCARVGTPLGHPEYNNCVNYYYNMNNWFERDRAPCLAEAKKTYPDFLYDRGGWVDVGCNGWHRHGGCGIGMTRVYPDGWKNKQIDTLRLTLMDPCMQKKGWNSASSWELGRSRPPFKP